MSINRLDSLQQLIDTSDCDVILVTKDNLHEYLLPGVPLHPAYKYLSETHKADYLRTYFMHFHGGGYSDVKKTTGSWEQCFNDLYNSDYWVCGYKEIPTGVAYPPILDKWRDLVGNGAYICKSNTPLTQEWYSSMIALLDTKLEQLMQFPARGPQDMAGSGTGYPLEWNEMLGRIFHRVCYKYKEKLLNTLPISIFIDYK